MSQNEENSNNKKSENPFSLPEGYFGSFSKKMMHKIELADELKEFKVLSSIEKKLPFATPVNYFESNGLKTELKAYPKLSAVKKYNAFSVPELYFETSSQSLKAKIEVAEELKAYPALYAITKENGYAVPQNYFDGLSHKLRSKQFSQQEESTVVKVLHLVFNKKTAYAIAAMLVLSLGLYFYSPGEETVEGNCGTLACLDKSEIFKGNQLLNLDEDALMEMVNTDKLSKNLKENLRESVKENGASDNKQSEEDYVIENVDVNDITDEI